MELEAEDDDDEPVEPDEMVKLEPGIGTP
jgi:hypothetical protein